MTLTARNVVKRYGGVTALADGSIEIRPGEVVTLVGANGSGKSTLSKIMTGVVSPDEGKLLLNGEPIRFSSPIAARNLGITAVYQELSLIPHLSVAENIWLEHEPRLFDFLLNPLRKRVDGLILPNRARSTAKKLIRRQLLGPFAALGLLPLELMFSFVDRRAMHRETKRLLGLFAGTFKSLEPGTLVGSLPPDERQIVEILKAISLNPRLIILDEATASLDSQQVNRLFDLVQQWKQEGMAVAFVSHRMDEIFRIADRATVLRNGHTVGDVAINEINERKLVEMMVEHAANPREVEISQAQADTPVRLFIQNLQTKVLKGASLTLRDGELLGIGGLQGQGQADLLLAVFGAIPFTGQIELGGEPVHFHHPREAMQQEIAYVPGDRGSQGLLYIRSILDNLQLPSWRRYGLPLKLKQARLDATQTAEELKLIYAGLDAPVSSLSGGNAQKVVLGKWLLRKPKLLLLNDPTKGVDVGAKGEFYNLLAELRAAGTAILFYSSDDEELLGLCDRVLVLHDGHIRAELSGDSLNRTELVAASMGTGQETVS